MKKIFLVTILLLISVSTVFADDKHDVLNVFNNYVKDANAYSDDLPSYYINNAKIIRVVNKRQGGQKAILIPYDRYVKELTGHAILARTVNYKNRYEHRKISKINNDYKVSAIRIPRNDQKGLPCYFIFTKTESGWKIKEESMTTNMQVFLTAK